MQLRADHFNKAEMEAERNIGLLECKFVVN